MKKKLLALLMSICVIFGVTTFSGCDVVTDTFDVMIENAELREENNQLKSENNQLKSELATLKFNLAFPNGLVTESCILNSVEITRTAVNSEGSIYAVRADGADVELVINDGYYNAGSGSLYNIAVWAHNGAHVVINDGEFVTGADVNGEANHVVYAAGNSTIEIKGGLFRSTITAPMMINCQDGKGTIIITGGTFVDFNPADCVSEGEHTSFLADGYEVRAAEGNDGSIWYTVVKSSEQ